MFELERGLHKQVYVTYKLSPFYLKVGEVTNFNFRTAKYVVKFIDEDGVVEFGEFFPMHLRDAAYDTGN